MVTRREPQREIPTPERRKTVQELAEEIRAGGTIEEARQLGLEDDVMQLLSVQDVGRFPQEERKREEQLIQTQVNLGERPDITTQTPFGSAPGLLPTGENLKTFSQAASQENTFINRLKEAVGGRIISTEGKNPDTLLTAVKKGTKNLADNYFNALNRGYLSGKKVLNAPFVRVRGGGDLTNIVKSLSPGKTNDIIDDMQANSDNLKDLVTAHSDNLVSTSQALDITNQQEQRLNELESELRQAVILEGVSSKQVEQLQLQVLDMKILIFDTRRGILTNVQERITDPSLLALELEKFNKVKGG